MDGKSFSHAHAYRKTLLLYTCHHLSAPYAVRQQPPAGDEQEHNPYRFENAVTILELFIVRLRMGAHSFCFEPISAQGHIIRGGLPSTTDVNHRSSHVVDRGHLTVVTTERKVDTNTCNVKKLLQCTNGCPYQDCSDIQNAVFSIVRVCFLRGCR